MKKPEKEPAIFAPAECCPDKPISAKVYPVIDTDIARDNLENNLTEADKQDL